jgi:hypothetical protein
MGFIAASKVPQVNARIVPLNRPWLPPSIYHHVFSSFNTRTSTAETVLLNNLKINLSHLVGCDTMQCCRIPTFQMSMLSPSSG